jgi:hypothetical protein
MMLRTASDEFFWFRKDGNKGEEKSCGCSTQRQSFRLGATKGDGCQQLVAAEVPSAG